MAQESRKHPRSNTRMEVSYQTISPSNNNEDTLLQHSATIIDLSKGGAGLLVEQPHQHNEIIWLKGIAGAHKPLQSTVQWVTEINGKYRVGIKFNPEQTTKAI